MYYVYVLENGDDKSWYIGYTSDLKRRLFEHQNGKGGRTTRLKKNWRLIYQEKNFHFSLLVEKMNDAFISDSI